MTWGFWTVGCVASGVEFKLRDKLLEKPGAPEPYVPLQRAKSWVRQVKQHKLVISPAFRQYIFLKFNNYSVQKDVLEQIHIPYRLIKHRDMELVKVRESEVNRVRQMESAGEFDNLPSALGLNVIEGTLVIVTDGPFKWLKGKVSQTPRSGGQEIRVEINNKKVKIPLSFLEAIG